MKILKKFLIRWFYVFVVDIIEPKNSNNSTTFCLRKRTYVLCTRIYTTSSYITSWNDDKTETISTEIR